MLCETIKVFHRPLHSRRRDRRDEYFFPSPLRGRRWKDTQSRLKREKETIRHIFFSDMVLILITALFLAFCHFAFRLPVPLKAGSAKSKMTTVSLRSLRLCGERVFLLPCTFETVLIEVPDLESDLKFVFGPDQVRTFAVLMVDHVHLVRPPVFVQILLVLFYG